MARRVRQNVMAQAGGSPQAVKQGVDLKYGKEYTLPANQRSMIFLFFEFGLFFAAGLAMWSVDQTIALVLFALAIAIPLLMYFYEAKKTPRIAVINEDSIVLKYQIGKPLTVFWDEIEFLQKLEVFERLSSKSRPMGWMKASTMKSPIVLSNKAVDAAIYAYTLKKGAPPPQKIIGKDSPGP